MIIQRKTRIEPSDVVVVGGVAYRADLLNPEMPCRTQCAFWDTEAMRCRGYCLRWENSSEVVFRRLMDERLVGSKAVVTATPDVLGEEILRRKKANHQHAVVKHRKKSSMK